MTHSFAILMATYNGESYILEQLQSIAQQDCQNWELLISDDGSSDNTLAIIQKWKEQHKNNTITLLSGPKKGFAANFFSLLSKAPQHSNYYAFSDQDDIFMPDKLTRAQEHLKKIPQSVPALYCSRTVIVDRQNNIIGYSPIPKRHLSFQNALVQNIASGNTMVFNQAAFIILTKTLSQPVPCHDWWTYLTISACHGEIIYDPKPSVRYRQHDQNLIGANHWTQQLFPIQGIRRMLQGINIENNRLHLEGLLHINNQMSPQNQKTAYFFQKARQNKVFLRRLYYLFKSKVYRQTRLGSLKLWIATLMNKI